MAKGDNIIEAHCAVCGKPITLADINYGFSTVVDGKMIHLHHDADIIKKLADPEISKALIDILKLLPAENEDELKIEIAMLSIRLNIPHQELLRYLDGAICRAKYSGVS